MEGIERLRGMLGGGFQKPLLKIFMYLKTREDMDKKYLNPEKNLGQMYEYIKSEAQKQAVKGIAVLDDMVVYSLAIHYFDESNKNLGLDKKEKKIETNKKNGNKEKENSNITEINPRQEDKEQISIFEGGDN